MCMVLCTVCVGRCMCVSACVWFCVLYVWVGVCVRGLCVLYVYVCKCMCVVL